MKKMLVKAVIIFVAFCICTSNAFATNTESEFITLIDGNSPIIMTANGLYWGTNSIKYYCDGFSTAEINAISSAFSSWSNVTYNSYSVSFSFTRVYSSSSADIVIEKDNILSGPLATSDIRDYYGRSSLNGTASGEIESATITLNSKYTYSIGASSGAYDLQSVFVHEIGHVLGIAHCHETGESCSYNCSNNVMNPDLSTGTTRRILQSYDKASLIVVYVFNHPF